MRYSLICNILGMMSKYIGALFIIPMFCAFLLKEANAIIPFLVTGAIAVVLGWILTVKKVEQKEIDNIKKSESLATVFFAWILFALICTIPYLFYGMDITNAVFEATSGVTTTGASIMDDYSVYPKTLFFFRSLTQWFGGMGIVVLFIAVLPRISVAGRQMFYAEAPTPTEDKPTPRIRYTASWLWGIYFALTIIELIILKFLGLDFFEATITSLSTIATGGFSHMQNSIYDFHNPQISLCVFIFMFIAGINYILVYRGLKNKKITHIFKSEEFRGYFGITLALGLMLALSLFINSHYEIKRALLNGFFEITATMTSTGFAVDNYIKWDATSKVILFLAFFTGGCAASTSGGIKIIRWIFIGKYLKRELNKIIHPQAIYPIKLEGAPVGQDIITQMVAFIIFYLVIFALGAFLIVLIENNTTIAISSSAAAIGNIGPAFGTIGPMDSFNALHNLTKWILILLMLIGRLEIIPFLAILNKDLWKN
ncbi:MAG: TrkH family potassium uptake protein [Candidatus Gastranaerophilales bacterium]|nr:TrkH family potassium uptake protein [Candidatus Gastranaerophilales bacterium]